MDELKLNAMDSISLTTPLSGNLNEEFVFMLNENYSCMDFRELIKNNIMPTLNNIDCNALLNQYWFDIKMKTISTNNKSNMIYPIYCDYISSQNDNNNDDEYWLMLDLNYNILPKQSIRNPLNIVIALDISGSMCYHFNGGISFGKNSDDNKMKTANKTIVKLLKSLNNTDRFGLITYNNIGVTVQTLQFIKDIDIEKLEKIIMNITENGGTNFENGYLKAIQLFESMNNTENQYENRIFFLSDDDKLNGCNKLLNLVRKYEKEQNIYTTLVGIGVDFDENRVEEIMNIKGCNCCVVKSNQEFINKLNHGLEYLINPLAFNINLKINLKNNNLWKIDGLYGYDLFDKQNIMNKGDVINLKTLFKS